MEFEDFSDVGLADCHPANVPGLRSSSLAELYAGITNQLLEVVAGSVPSGVVDHIGA